MAATTGCYMRLLCAIHFISNSSDANITVHGFIRNSGNYHIRQYRAEARFLKALALYHALDLFGNIPDITNETKFPGSNLPQQIKRANLFKYIQSELLALESILPAPGANQQYRADQAAALGIACTSLPERAGLHRKQSILPMPITYCNKIINAGKYSLSPKLS